MSEYCEYCGRWVGPAGAHNPDCPHGDQEQLNEVEADE